MKNMLLIFVTLLTTSACSTVDTITSPFDKTTVAAKKEQSESSEIKNYREQLEKCDAIADYDLEFGDLSTAGMDASIDKQIQCYESVAHQIIDKYYSERSKQIKQRFDEYIKLSYKISMDSYWPDSCQPACGTMTTGMAYYYALQDTKRYLDNLIYAIKLF